MQDFTIEEYKKLQSEISSIRNRIKDLNRKKEYWFQRKESLKKDLNDHIAKIKEIKSQKDQKKNELNQLKSERDKYNSIVKELISKIKDVNDNKAKAFKKYNVSIDPEKIQEKINALEKKVEIETSFEKEKKLMEEIKKLKRTYGETSEVLKIAEEAAKIQKEIRDARKKANEFHKKVIDTTRDTSYLVFMEFSRKINETKSLQEQAFQTFIDHKNQYSALNDELKKKLETNDMLSKVLSKNNELKKFQELEKNKKIVKDKLIKAEEKMKSKKRLTTEDILAFQGKEMLDG